MGAYREIGEYLAREQCESQITGLCVGLAEVGRPAKTWSLGYANLEHRVQTTVDTVFKIGSISKHIVAAGIMLLEEDGVVNFDQKIARYLPGLPAGWNDITVMQLLTHTSGLRRDPVNQQFQAVGSLKSIIFARENFQLESAPGEAWKYSNLGYFLLGYLLEQVTQEPFANWFHRRLFRILSMNSTRTTSAYAIIMNRASSYYFLDGVILNAGDLKQFRPSGAFVSTLRDLLTWDRSLRDATLVSKEGLDRMATQVRLATGEMHPYGFGWHILRDDRDTVLYHAGGLWSFRSLYRFSMRLGFSIIILANCRETNVAGLASGILTFLAPDTAALWANAISAQQA